MRCDAVIFDMDGVLVDSEPLHHAKTNEVLAPLGARVDADLYVRCTGMPDVDFFALLVERFGLGEDPRRLAQRRHEAVVRAMAQAPLLPMPEALECLLALRAEGLVLGLASSSVRELVDLVVGKLGLARTLGACVAIDDVARGKPAPDLFVEAARRLRVDPARCVVVEDAALGVAAARAAGMRVVALVPEGADAAHREQGASVSIPSLQRLDAALLEALPEP